MAPKVGVEYDEAAVDYLIEKHYRAVNRPFRCCQPRDLLLQIRNYCRYVRKPAKHDAGKPRLRRAELLRGDVESGVSSLTHRVPDTRRQAGKPDLPVRTLQPKLSGNCGSGFRFGPSSSNIRLGWMSRLCWYLLSYSV